MRIVNTMRIGKKLRGPHPYFSGSLAKSLTLVTLKNINFPSSMAKI